MIQKQSNNSKTLKWYGIINKNLIHFKTKSVFDQKLTNSEILDTSIVFIQDTKEIWTHGQFYDCSWDINTSLDECLTEAELQEVLSPIQTSLTNKLEKRDLAEYAKTENVPTKVSELINDNNFISADTAQQLIDTAIANLDIGGSSGGTDTEVSTKGGTTLFEVLTINANFSDVTLSQSSANFTQLDICCCTDVGETVFISVYNPNGQVFNVSSSIQESGELIIKSKQYEIRNSNIISVSGLGGMVSVSSGGISTVDGNYIGIYKVIGY